MTLRITFIILLLSASLAQFPVFAQDDTSDIDKIEERFEPKQRKFYLSSAIDAAIFSTSVFTRPGKSEGLSTLRFSYFFNFGVNFNYDFNKAIGLYTGLGIKNIGFIDKAGAFTIKRRVYTIGAPLGIKIGNLKRKNYLVLGGGVDVPFNYRQKDFIRRGDKQKFNEWFSDRTAMIMPYAFLGSSFSPGITLKLQYYPTNFMNTDYTEPTILTGVQYAVYSGYNVNLVLLSAGVNFRYKRKSGSVSANSSMAAL